jgi:hypothetical protein
MLALMSPFPLTSYPFLKWDNRTGDLAVRGCLDRGSRPHSAPWIQIRLRLLPFPNPTASVRFRVLTGPGLHPWYIASDTVLLYLL